MTFEKQTDIFRKIRTKKIKYLSKQFKKDKDQNVCEQARHEVIKKLPVIQSSFINKILHEVEIKMFLMRNIELIS